MIAFGFLTRFAAAAATIFLFVAIVRVHLPNGFFFMKDGIEYPLLWMVVTLAVFLKGGGPFSIDARLGKEL
jgi:putative oxidoreductase